MCNLFWRHSKADLERWRSGTNASQWESKEILFCHQAEACPPKIVPWKECSHSKSVLRSTKRTREVRSQKSINRINWIAVEKKSTTLYYNEVYSIWHKPYLGQITWKCWTPLWFKFKEIVLSCAVILTIMYI